MSEPNCDRCTRLEKVIDHYRQTLDGQYTTDVCPRIQCQTAFKAVAEEAQRLREQDHCCEQLAGISRVDKQTVERLGSCGCVQAKQENEQLKKDIVQLEYDNRVLRNEAANLRAARPGFVTEHETNQ